MICLSKYQPFQAISKCNYFINFPTSRDAWSKMKEAHRHYSVEEMYLNSLSFPKSTNQYLGHTTDSDDPFLARICKRTKQKNGSSVNG